MNNKVNPVLRTVILLVLGIVYLALFGVTFAFNINLEVAKGMQYALHSTVILTAFAYLFFVDFIYSMEEDKTNGKMALIFGALFTIPVLIGRGIGLAALSNEFNSINNILNFYGDVSISRSIEMVSWTTFFPFSILYLAKIFYSKKKRILSILCLISSACCFIAFLSFISPSIIYMLIGVLGWGVLFTIIIIIYLFELIRYLHKSTNPTKMPEKE
jgi:hypothetical protein